MKTKTLPTGIVTTQRKVGKKIIIDVKRQSTKNVTRLQKLVVGFLFSLAYLGICGSIYQIYVDLFSRVQGLIFLPLFLGKMYVLTIMAKHMFSEFKNNW